MHNKTSYKVQKGFTLVELAIVLVIIGLIVSSVIVGQDLIRASQLRTVIRQQTEYQLAVNTFLGKYNALPGDIPNADAYGFAAGTNGDGNRLLSDTNGATTFTANVGEVAFFWLHLTTPRKELISGSYNASAGASCAALGCIVGDDIPAMKFGSSGWAVYGDPVTSVNYFVAGVSFIQPTTQQYQTNPTFTPQEAYNIDVKVDDGLPDAGNVTGGIVGGLDAVDGGCTTGAGGTYALNTATPQCTLRFVMQTF